MKAGCMSESQELLKCNLGGERGVLPAPFVYGISPPIILVYGISPPINLVYGISPLKNLVYGISTFHM